MSDGNGCNPRLISPLISTFEFRPKAHHNREGASQGWNERHDRKEAQTIRKAS
jgi:hypothetical protein